VNKYTELSEIYKLHSLFSAGKG